jgi:multidrug resistance protein, MATE family
MNHPKSTERASIRLKELFGYFYPELITAFLLYIVLDLIDFRFIAHTNIPLGNATQGVANALFHVTTKVAEGFSVGMVIMCGQYNGAHEYARTGRTVSDAFWTMVFFGALISVALYGGAQLIFTFYEVPQDIIKLGIPYMRIRTLGVFFSFIYFALIGFLRGIKNTKAPMAFFLLGGILFVVLDYALIFGAWGMPALGLQGSAIATVCQYGIMLVAALLYILHKPEYRKYGISLFAAVKWANVRDLVHLSWPVMIDKGSFALCSMWLYKMISCAAAASSEGGLLIESAAFLKQIEKISILPALAFAQVITFLVSNDYKIHHFTSIKKNIKKVLILSALLVGLFILPLCLFPTFFLGKKAAFSVYISYALPCIVILIFFDVVQLILSAALRGAADVKTVMWSRMVSSGLFFVPLAYLILQMPLDNLIVKFILLYGSIHISYALMSLIYIVRFKSGAWRKQTIKGD